MWSQLRDQWEVRDSATICLQPHWGVTHIKILKFFTTVYYNLNYDMYKFTQFIECFIQVIIYTSVNLGQPSGMMGHDDLHKTTGQYSELQQEPQQESSFNEGTIILPEETWALRKMSIPVIGKKYCLVVRKPTLSRDATNQTLGVSSQQEHCSL